MCAFDILSQSVGQCKKQMIAKGGSYKTLDINMHTYCLLVDGCTQVMCEDSDQQEPRLKTSTKRIRVDGVKADMNLEGRGVKGVHYLHVSH